MDWFKLEKLRVKPLALSPRATMVSYKSSLYPVLGNEWKWWVSRSWAMFGISPKMDGQQEFRESVSHEFHVIRIPDRWRSPQDLGWSNPDNPAFDTHMFFVSLWNRPFALTVCPACHERVDSRSRLERWCIPGTRRPSDGRCTYFRWPL
jgi:hypothetical protein